MIIVLCEGVLDMEILMRIFECKGFNRERVEKNYIKKKLGLGIKRYYVLKKDDKEVIIFYPWTMAGYNAILNIAKDISEQKNWKKRNVVRVALAVDLDNLSVNDRIKAIKNSLENVYDKIEESGNFSFKCSKDKEEFLFTVIPLGDCALNQKIDTNQEKCMVEDLILNLLITEEKYKNICKQSIELYKHKTKEKPCQKSLLKMMEAFSKDPDRGFYEILSELKEKLLDVLPEHIEQSINEVIEG